MAQPEYFMAVLIFKKIPN